MIDLTEYTKAINMDGCLTELFVVIKKDMYDEIRKHDGEFYCDGSIFILKNFTTDYIDLGPDADFHTCLIMEETEWSRRDRKLKELGL